MATRTTAWCCSEHASVGFVPGGLTSVVAESSARICSVGPRMAAAESQVGKGKVVVIAGPTAVGKSSVAMELARRCGGEIISADSVQVYTDLDVGSNKPSAADLAAVRHHLIDVADPRVDDYTAGSFFRDARAAADDVLARGKLPVVVGGTSMYLRWFVNGKPPTPEASNEVRDAVEREVSRAGGDWDDAVRLLEAVDPERAAELCRNDWYRLKRSLEIVRTSGDMVSAFPKSGAAPTAPAPTLAESPYDVRCFFLFQNRRALAELIDERCELMLAESGLIAEVAQLLMDDKLRLQSSPARAIGYRQVTEYLLSRARDVENRADPYEAFREFLNGFMSTTRQYARRQMQWFRNDRTFLWMSTSGGRAKLAEDIDFLLKLDRKDFDVHLDGAEQTEVRRQSVAEGTAMKRYVSMLKLVLPGSRTEAELVDAAESAALSLQGSRAFQLAEPQSS